MALPTNIGLGWKQLAKDEHKAFCSFVSEKEKKFYIIDTWSSPTTLMEDMVRPVRMAISTSWPKHSKCSVDRSVSTLSGFFESPSIDAIK